MTAAQAKRAINTWCKKHLLTLIDEDLAQRSENLKVLDFVALPGRVSAKIENEQNKLTRIEIQFEEISEEKWNEVFDELSSQALFIAMLLAGYIPEEIETAFSKADIKICPDSIEQVSAFIDGSQTSAKDERIIAVLLQFCNKVLDDPFTLFLIHGKGRDEVLHELRKRRQHKVKNSKDRKQSLAYHQAHYSEAPPISTLLDNFWGAKEELKKLNFNIKADELPAAILKWLDPIPLGGLEEDAEFLFEEAYEHVTRRAQAFGLGL